MTLIRNMASRLTLAAAPMTFLLIEAAGWRGGGQPPLRAREKDNKK